MSSVRLFLVAVTAVMLPMVVSASAYAELKTGVVDIVEVTNGYERTKDASIDLQTEQQALKATSEPKVNKLKEMLLRRDGMTRGSDDWKRLDDEALKFELDVRTSIALEQAKIERKHRDVLLDMYRDIVKVVTRLAKEKALDVVFTKAFLLPPQINLDESTGLEDLKNRIVGQRLLFPTTSADLTQDVLKALNAEYKPAKRPTAPAAGPATTPLPPTPTVPAPKG
jgi:Skp family chaperone for outer membrane proteins